MDLAPFNERVNRYKNDKKDEPKLVNELIELFRDPLYSFHDRSACLEMLIDADNFAGEDEMNRVLHSMMYLSGKEKKNECKLLMTLSLQPWLSINHRYQCCMVLFGEKDFYNEAYECFDYISRDTTLPPKYRVDACKFLVYSTLDENRDTALNVMKELILDEEWKGDNKIDAILSFAVDSDGNNNVGMRTLFLGAPLYNDYDEEFCCELMITFFGCKKHPIRLRIIAVEYLLQAESIKTNEKLFNNIAETLWKDGNNSQEENNHRLLADIADVLIQLGNDEWKKKGEELLNSIRWSDIPELQRNIYTDAENIHDEQIRKSLMKFIHERFVEKKYPVEVVSVDDVVQSIAENIYRLNSSKAQQKAMDSLQRIKRDQIRYGSCYVSPIQVLVYIWQYIQEYYNKTERKRFVQAFMQEMVWMADTCSSGHVGRLLNVLNIDENKESTLTISFESQLKANIQARINTKINLLEDDDRKGKILLGIMNDADESDKNERREFAVEVEESLHNELHNEFVYGGHMTKKEFNDVFDSVYGEWKQ